MIDDVVFANWMGIFGERYNRPMGQATSLAYYDILARELTTEQFVVGAQLALRECQFWPTPEDIIARAKPVRDTALEGTELFTDILSWLGKPNLMAQVREKANEAGVRAFLAVGGPGRFQRLLLTEEPYARKEFIAAYVGAAHDADESARVERALAAADARALPTAGPRIHHGLTPIGNDITALIPERSGR